LLRFLKKEKKGEGKEKKREIKRAATLSLPSIDSYHIKKRRGGGLSKAESTLVTWLSRRGKEEGGRGKGRKKETN